MAVDGDKPAGARDPLDRSIADILGSASRRDHQSRSILIWSVVAALVVALVSGTAAALFAISAQANYQLAVKTADERTVQYTNELAARDAQIAALNAQIIDLTNRLSPVEILASGAKGLTVEKCRIASGGETLVDLRRSGCAASAAINPDGRVAVADPAGLVTIYFDARSAGGNPLTIDLDSPDVALTWSGPLLVAQTGSGERFIDPDSGKLLDPPMAGIEREDYTVFVQFAGAIVRGDMVTLSTQLVSLGWAVQGADKGGQRIESTFGFNEVRYSDDDDREAAEALAQEVTQAAANIKLSVELKAVQVISKGDGIDPRTLEIWISRL